MAFLIIVFLPISTTEKKTHSVNSNTLIDLQARTMIVFLLWPNSNFERLVLLGYSFYIVPVYARAMPVGKPNRVKKFTPPT